MSDSLDRGLTADPTLLGKIASPREVNYLDIQNSAAKTAEGIWATRDWQAKQAAGEASQQATDSEGNYDPAKAQAIMARNPAAALDYQRSAIAGQELGNKQLGLNRDQMGTIARSVSSVLSLPDDQQTPENYRAALDHALSQGAITKAHHDAGVANLPTAGGPEAMRNYGTRLLIGTLAGPDVADRSLPRWQMTNTGGTVQPQISQPATAGGAVTNAPGATVITTDPNTGAAMHKVYVKRPDGTYQEELVPRDKLPGANAPPHRGGAAPPVPSSIPGGGVYKPRPAPGGTPAAAPPAATPSAPTPDTPVLAAPPQGQPASVDADVGAYKTATLAMPDQRRSLVAGDTALEALRLAKTGPKSETLQRIRAFAQTYHIPLPGSLEGPENYDIARKNLLRFAQTQSKASGTDLGLETQLHSNANVESMLQGAAEHVVIQDLGLARQRVAQTLEAPDKNGIGYGEHTKRFTGDTDPRGFAWDLYSPEQQDKIEKDAAKTKGGLEKLDRSIEIAAKHGLIKIPTGAAPAPSPTPAAPPRPVAARPNPLTPP